MSSPDRVTRVLRDICGNVIRAKDGSTDIFPKDLPFSSRTVEPASNLAGGQWRMLSFLAVFISPGGGMKLTSAGSRLSSVQENPAAVL